MYLLTYVGRMINGLTILILIWVSIFSAPRIYKDNQAKIDEAIGPIKIKLEELTSKLKGAKKEEWGLKFKFYDSHPIQIDRKSEYRSTCHWKSCQGQKVTFSNIIINMRKKILCTVKIWNHKLNLEKTSMQSDNKNVLNINLWLKANKHV